MRHTNEHLLLAIFPSTRGFGFAVFEGPHRPIDWGIKEIRRDKNALALLKVRELIDWFHPDIIVLEDYAGEGSRRSKRIQRLIERMARLAHNSGVRTARYSRALIRESFAPVEAVTKHEIAQAIATQLPELGRWLPPERKIWMSEDPRMSMFDALALVFTFFHFEGKRRKAA